MAGRQDLNDLLLGEYSPRQIAERDREKKEKERRRRKRQEARRRLWIAALCAGIFFVYLATDYSHVQDIVVTGNRYLSKEEVMELGALGYESRWALVFPGYVRARLKTNPLVEDAQVRVDPSGSVRIRMTMKKAVAYYGSSGDSRLVFADGSEEKIEGDLYQALAYVPYLKDVDDPQIRALLVEKLGSLPEEVIAGISEIWMFHETYDSQMFRFLMSDGNQVFMNREGISAMEFYYKIAENADQGNSCIMISEDGANAYTRDCEELNAEESAALEADAQSGEESGGQQAEGE